MEHVDACHTCGLTAPSEAHVDVCGWVRTESVFDVPDPPAGCDAATLRLWEQRFRRALPPTDEEMLTAARGQELIAIARKQGVIK